MDKNDKRYRKLMMKAINVARTSCLHVEKPCSKQSGLRVIKDFEKVNGISFDPSNQLHLGRVAGMAHHSNFLRRAKRIIRREIK
jgi:hypothetical protein